MSILFHSLDASQQRALVAALLVSISGPPLGVFLVLRRMSLMGDVIAHALLPGTAAGFIVAGLSVAAMSIGGLIAGFLVALAAGLATRFTSVREDANLASFYLLFVAIGVWLLATHGSSRDLEDILFGDALSVERAQLFLMAAVSCATLCVLALIYRPLVVESFDPLFLRSVGGKGGLYHVVFMMLVVLNMVEGYRALGTLMASGLLLIPAVIAQFWTKELSRMIGLAVVLAVFASLLGLGLAFCYGGPSGPPIVMVAGGFYLFSMLLGRYGSLRARYFPWRHLER